MSLNCLWKKSQGIWAILLFVSPVVAEKKEIIQNIGIGKFIPHQTSKSVVMEEKIIKQLKTNLELLYGNTILIEGDTNEQRVSNCKQSGCFVLVEGFYKKDKFGNLYIFGQIYHPESGWIIDAVNSSDELTDLDGIQLDLNEEKESVENTIKTFTKKITTRIQLNKNRSEKRENINKSLMETSIGKVLESKIRDENKKIGAEEAFKILAEQSKVSVASNVTDDAGRQPASVSIISQKEIEMSGARSVIELLNTFVPGFFMVEDQDDRIAGFRGLASDSNAKVLLLLNGHTMNTEWQFGPPDSIINSLNIHFIERIEVIRGPGSVTLGQGALLGVINIITKNGSTSPGMKLSASSGKDNYRQYAIQAGMDGKELKDLKALVYYGNTYYSGQKLQNSGWAHQKYYEGADVRGFDTITDSKEIAVFQESKTLETYKGFNLYQNIYSASGNRLLRGDNTTVNSILQYKGFEFNGFYANQLRDNFAFYRDRNEVKNTIKTGNFSYKKEISDALQIKVKTFYTQDDYGFQSHNGTIMAGVRENRYGGSVITNWNINRNHSLAAGFEFKKYDMGQPDENGNNYIINRDEAQSFYKNPKSGTSLKNQTNRFVYPESVNVGSFFMEDFYKLTKSVEAFGAFRYDKHPFWGGNVSPSLGLIFIPTSKIRFRTSYREGFRGAVGAAYSGGYQRDGLLSNKNFDKVQMAGIPKYDQYGNKTFEGNIPNAIPEKMRSYELAMRFMPVNMFYIDAVGYYNQIVNVIDVGVLCGGAKADCSASPPKIGTDEPGDWNGYWFFRNTPGTLKQVGGELLIGFQNRYIDIKASHSSVKVLNAEDELHSSQYLTSDKKHKHFKAYPENISRINIIAKPLDKLYISLHYLYFYKWFSPQGQPAKSPQVVNMAAGYSLLEKLDVILNIKNVLNTTELWPMNSNAGGKDLSSGFPSYERRTYWLSMNYHF